jgi:hypothetical protein
MQANCSALICAQLLTPSNLMEKSETLDSESQIRSKNKHSSTLIHMHKGGCETSESYSDTNNELVTKSFWLERNAPS